MGLDFSHDRPNVSHWRDDLHLRLRVFLNGFDTRKKYNYINKKKNYDTYFYLITKRPFTLFTGPRICAQCERRYCLQRVRSQFTRVQPVCV